MIEMNKNYFSHESALAIYQSAKIIVTQAAQCEAESSEYGACRFGLNGHHVVFREAKTTPKKTGQFVTLWKRSILSGEIVPLDSGDGIDFVIISVANATYRGQFIFNKQALLKHHVLSHMGKGGKRAIRVYPPWSSPVAKEALKTQSWQLRYFLPITQDMHADAMQVRQLFMIEEK
jgi:hypothetical protein